MGFFDKIWDFVSGTETEAGSNNLLSYATPLDLVLQIHMTLPVEQGAAGNVIFLICGLHQKKL